MYRVQYVTQASHRLFCEETVTDLPVVGDHIERKDNDRGIFVTGEIHSVDLTIFDFFHDLKRIPQYIVTVKTTICQIPKKKY
jgi:uncharacterized protein YkvS